MKEETREKVEAALAAIVQHDHHGFNGSARLQMESMTSLARSALALIREDQDGCIESATTSRGFGRYNFTDQYGVACSIQESSLAEPTCIWLGCNEIGLKRFEPGNAVTVGNTSRRDLFARSKQGI